MAADRQFILNEVRRTASQNNGVPLGTRAFRRETGIAEHDWKGRYWARWSDALIEAGLEPLEWNTARGDEELFEALVKLVRRHHKYPANSDILLDQRSDVTIPRPETIRRRFGSKVEVIQKLRDYCEAKDYSDVHEILAKESIVAQAPEAKGSPLSESVSTAGYVYLAKSGRNYKIGRSNSHGRRMYELAIQLPDDLEQVHVIVALDDPVGIEKYWHDRFKEKRLNGEWFSLTSDEVRAFKKRKYM